MCVSMHCHNFFNTSPSACCVHRICSQPVTHSWSDESSKQVIKITTFPLVVSSRPIHVMYTWLMCNYIWTMTTSNHFFR